MLPLDDKTIVITRPRDQAFELKSELERLGAKIILAPTIEVVPPDNYAELDEAVQNLSNYDWLIFTSANASEYFLRRLEATGLETAELDYLRVCAIGEATFERLRIAQVHVDVLPTHSRAETVFDQLCEYLGGADELRNLRFLIPGSSIARDFLPKKLKEAQAAVKSVVAYQTILSREFAVGKIKALFRGGAIDCVTFSSPSTFNSFVKLLNSSDLPLLLDGVTIACIGETTAQSVRESGLLKVDVVSSQANAQNFAKAIASFYQ